MQNEDFVAQDDQQGDKQAFQSITPGLNKSRDLEESNAAQVVPGLTPAPGQLPGGPSWRGHLLAATILLLATFYLYSALLVPAPLSTHEASSLYLRPWLYLQEFRAGLLVPMLLPQCITGMGHAFPVFYPPFSHYVAAFLDHMTSNVVMGTHLSLLLSVYISALTMHALGTRLVGPVAGCVAGLLYISIPYRFVDVLGRGAAAECWSFAWYPLAIHGLLDIMDRRSGSWKFSLGVALSLLSHTVMAMYFLSMTAVIFGLWVIATRRIPAAVLALSAGLIGCGLAAFYLVPQQLYMKTVFVSEGDLMLISDEHIDAHRVVFSQLFSSSPDRFFGFSSRWSQGLQKDTMSYELGLGILIALGVALAGVLLGDRSRDVSRYRFLAHASLLASALLVILELYPLEILSFVPRQFRFIQFCWRALGLQAFFATFGFLCGLRLLSSAFSIPQAAVATCGMVFVSAVPHYMRSPEYKTSDTPESLTTPWEIQFRGYRGFTELAEYLPRTFMRSRFAIAKYYPPLVKGDGEVISWSCASHTRWTVNLEARKPSTVVFQLAAYPYWKISGPGAGSQSLVTENGQVAVKVPAGQQTILLERHVPQPMRLGGWISLGSICLLSGLAAGESRFRRMRRISEAAGPSIP